MKASNNIQHIINDRQYATKEGSTMPTMAKKVFIHSLIREYCSYSPDGYSLHVSDLNPIDQKLLLSYVLSAEDYEMAISSPTKLQVEIDEFRKDMQFLINGEIDDVFAEDIEEMGLHVYRHKDGDCFVVRK